MRSSLPTPISTRPLNGQIACTAYTIAVCHLQANLRASHLLHRCSVHEIDSLAVVREQVRVDVATGERTRPQTQSRDNANENEHCAGLVRELHECNTEANDSFD